MAQSGKAQEHGIVDTEYYSFIDGLRGVAILMVLMTHSIQFSEEKSVSHLLGSLIGAGGRGVQLFFILSAFTLFSSSLQRFTREKNPRRNFYVRRAFRILPLWWLALLVYFLLKTLPPDDVGGAPSNFLNLLLHGTFLFGFSPSYMSTLMPGGWSLFVEETFYLMLPFIYTRVTGLAQAANLTLALFIVAVGWYLPARVYLWQFSFCYFFPLSQWFIFGLGIILFFAHKTSRSAFSNRGTAIVLDILALFGLWNAFIGSPPGPVHFTAAFALLTFCFAVSQKASLLRWLVDNPPLRLFGRCCYSIYLFHWLIVSSVRSWRMPVLANLGLGPASTDVRFVAWYLVLACICLGFGMLSFYCVEKPMVSVGRMVIKRLERVDGRISGADSMPVGGV